MLSSRAPVVLPANLARLAGLIRCPTCRGTLELGRQAVSCAGCGARFEVHDGIPLLGRVGGTQALGELEAGDTSADYQTLYEDASAAAAYDRRYRTRWRERRRTRREHGIVAGMLASLPESDVILDLPCGGGRMSGLLGRRTRLLLEADVSFGQVGYARGSAPPGAERAWLTASAFHIPLDDGAVELVACIRLAHHLPSAAERERLFAELLRVARRAVIVSFVDRRSLKSLSRRLRGRPVNRKAMTPEEVASLAERHGARLVRCPSVSLVGSRHRFALLEKPARGGR